MSKTSHHLKSFSGANKTQPARHKRRALAGPAWLMYGVVRTYKLQPSNYNTLLSRETRPPPLRSNAQSYSTHTEDKLSSRVHMWWMT